LYLYVHWLASIVESSEDAIASQDLDGVVSSWNSGAERLFGYTTDETIGKPVTILIPSDRHHEETDILDCIRRGERVDSLVGERWTWSACAPGLAAACVGIS
jgi:PAS domain S-box-containing protein